MGKTNIQRLESYGDVELWLAKGHDGSWCFPLHVNWKFDRENNLHYGAIYPACGTYKSQSLALIALLQFHDIQGRRDRWIIERKMVETLLHKAPGITETYYYKWPDDSMPPIALADKKPLLIHTSTGAIQGTSGMSEDFVKHVSSVYSLQSSVVRVILRAIKAEAPKWMLLNRKPLDLGFCHLVAAPFRSNWKEIICAKYKKWKLLGLFDRAVVRRQELEAAGIPDAFCSTDNIGLKKIGKGHRIAYTLEAIPTNLFENAVNIVETQRQACGTTSYVASFEKTVESLYQYLCQAMASYLRKSQTPFASLSADRSAGSLRFLPARWGSYKVRGVRLRDLPVRILETASGFSVFGERSRDATIVRAKAPPVPQVPSLPPATDDLRECEEQRDVVEQGQAGAAGVLVFHVGQGADTGEPVLPEPTVTVRDSLRVDGLGN